MTRLWDDQPDAPITPEEAHAVAADWKNTTQLSNALDAAAHDLERIYKVVDEKIESVGELVLEQERLITTINDLHMRHLLTMQALRDLHAEVEMAESVGICLPDRGPSLRAGDLIGDEMSKMGGERWFVLRIMQPDEGPLDEDAIKTILAAAEVGANSVGFEQAGVAIPYAAKVGPEIRAFTEGSQ